MVLTENIMAAVKTNMLCKLVYGDFVEINFIPKTVGMPGRKYVVMNYINVEIINKENRHRTGPEKMMWSEVPVTIQMMSRKYGTPTLQMFNANDESEMIQ